MARFLELRVVRIDLQDWRVVRIDSQDLQGCEDRFTRPSGL